MDDYIHLLRCHLDNDINGDIFGDIYKYFINTIHIPTCNISICSKYFRNSRERENENINIINKTDKVEDNNDDIKMNKIYIDILDTIHCNFIHSFDSGCRINNIKTNDDIISSDIIMNKMSKILKKKKELLKNIRGSNRIINNKYVTKFNDNNDNNDKYSVLLDFMFAEIKEYNALLLFKEYLHNNKYDSESILYDICDNNKSNSNIFMLFFNDNQNQVWETIKRFMAKYNPC